MAIDLNAVRNKLASLQSKTAKQNNLWKPEPGTHVVRIIPYVHDKSNPFLELYFHYNFAGKTILSPISFGRPDPIVEFAEKLKSTGKKDDWAMGRKLEPKMRCYVPVLVRGKESDGPKFWGFGKQVYQELLGFINDPDYGDITDPSSGRDVSVEFKSKEQTGKDFPETSIRVKPNTTPITNSKDVLEKIGTMQVITDIFKEPTYEDLEKVLQEWLNPSEKEETSPAATAKSEGKSTKANSAVAEEAHTAETVSDVASAFDELFRKK